MSKLANNCKQIKEDSRNTHIIDKIYIAMIVGSIIALPFLLFSDRFKENSTNYILTSSDYSNITITLKQANAYVGRTLKELCAKYGNTVNLHAFAFSIKYGGSGVPCSEVGKGYYFDNYIISQAYYDEEYINSKKYKDMKKFCEETNIQRPSYCDEPLSVYVDSMPRDEAIEAGIKIK